MHSWNGFRPVYPTLQNGSEFGRDAVGALLRVGNLVGEGVCPLDGAVLWGVGTGADVAQCSGEFPHHPNSEQQLPSIHMPLPTDPPPQ